MAANTNPPHKPGLLRNTPGVRCIPESIGKELCIGTSASMPPLTRELRNASKCEEWKAIFSKMPIASGGKTAQRNGVRRDHAEISSSHAYRGAYQRMCTVTRW